MSPFALAQALEEQNVTCAALYNLLYSSGDDLQDLQETVVKGVAATAAAVVVGYAAFKRAR